MNTHLLKAACTQALPIPGTGEAGEAGKIAAAPEWIQLMPVGVNQGRDGRGPYVLSDAAGVARVSMSSAPATGIPVDYEHQTEHTLTNGQPAPAAGWITAMEARTDGLWAQVEWTDKATAHIAAREYRSVSPVFYHDAAGHVGRVESVGLTNLPNLNLKALNRNSNSSNSSNALKDYTMHKSLARITGLPEGADEAAVEKAVASALQQLESFKDALKKVQTLLGMTATDADLEAVEKAVNSVLVERDTLKAAARMATVETLVAEALAAGKITPAQETWAKSLASQDPESLRAYMATAPDLRPGAGQPSTPQTPPADGLTPEQKALCRATGITTEEFLKSNGITKATGATA